MEPDLLMLLSYLNLLSKERERMRHLLYLNNCQGSVINLQSFYLQEGLIVLKRLEIHQLKFLK